MWSFPSRDYKLVCQYDRFNKFINRVFVRLNMNFLHLFVSFGSSFCPFSSVFNSFLLSFSSLFLYQNIILPIIEVHELLQSQRNLTLALSLNFLQSLGISLSVGSSVHSSGLKTLKMSSKVVCQNCDNFSCGVALSPREAMLYLMADLQSNTGLSFFTERKKKN